MYKRVPSGLYEEKIVDGKLFGNFKRKTPNWPNQDLSNKEQRNKVMKNQHIQGIL